MGRLEEAEVEQRAALRSRINVFGEKHPDVAQSYNNVGWVLLALERFREAQEVLEKGISIAENLFGKRHVEVMMYRGNLELAKIGLREQERISAAKASNEET